MKKQLHCWPPALGTILVLAAGCGPRLGAAADAGALLVTSTDAGPAVALEFRIEVQRPDGGRVSAVLDPAVVAVLPVTWALDVTANLPLQNYRIRIFDEIDRALASDDSPDEASAGLRYHVGLLAPLRAGHRYVVLVDAQKGSAFEDGRGASQTERRFEFRTEGEREKDVPVKGTQVKHRHRGT